VKESLALMYQMMQLHDKALAQYEELEQLIHLADSQSSLAGNSPLQDRRNSNPLRNAVHYSFRTPSLPSTRRIPLSEDRGSYSDPAYSLKN
jgi:hypothetical protein